MKKLWLVVILILSACSERVGPERSDDDAIQIAFFAELIDRHPSESASAYCVSHGAWENRQDPASDVLTDLRSLFGKVQPGSACVVTETDITFEGNPARAYHIDSVVRTGNTATVTGFYRQGATIGATYQAELEQQGSFWVVASMELVDQVEIQR
ncbi:MAG TPA: hypothetical protein VFO52_02960 [Longimicrobiales bacterium]|nr:hypothetical protein [Longimicrobiales bacterium]